MLPMVAALWAPVPAPAQSAETLRAYQAFEEARASTDASAALKSGRAALLLADSPATDPAELTDLLLRVAEVAARAGEDLQALELYQRALTLEEAQLGADHPDLVPTLTALAKLHASQQRYPEAEALLQRVLVIERAAYGPQHANVLATLKTLREVLVAAGDQTAVAGVDEQIARFGFASRGFPEIAAAPESDRRYKQTPGGFATVRVFYGTNRAVTGDPKPARYYGGVRGELQYGYLDVTIPQAHQEAELETQSRWSVLTLGVADLRRRFVLLDKVMPLSGSDFITALRAQIRSAPSRDVFIFVHGFNVTFEDAARRTAQLAYDLDFDGTPLMYSWPSQGSTTAYTVDEAAVQISGRKMADFLEQVATQSGAQRIHLIAHSMGNRALIEALQTFLAKRAPSDRKNLFGQVVFTAPDVDRDYFVDAIESLRDSAARVTLYASDKDVALRTSQLIHGAPRAGTAGASIITLPGLDTIDMSEVAADRLGHSYFAANAGAIFDLFRLLWRGDPPPQRCGMSAQHAGAARPLDVWLFNVDICKGDDLMQAGVLLKRFGDVARAHALANIASLTDPSQKLEWSRILTQLDTLLLPPPQPSLVQAPLQPLKAPRPMPTGGHP
jgi:esterase/lipase superfamily enzyme